MLSKAYENQYDIAILVAGDEDFLPIVDAVKSAGKRVYGAYFESHVSQELKESFDNSLILNREWFINQSLKGKVVLEKFQIHSNYKMMGKMHASITITTVKAALHLLLIDKDGKERDIEFCGLAKYNAGEPKTIDLKLNTEVDKNDWEKQSIILYVKDDKGIVAYRGMDLCSLACCQALGGVLGC